MVVGGLVAYTTGVNRDFWVVMVKAEACLRTAEVIFYENRKQISNLSKPND